MSRKIILFLLIFLSFILGIRIFSFFVNSHSYKNGEEVYIKTTLLTDPKKLSRGQQLYLNVSSGQSILITLKATPEIGYGDVVEIKGRLTEKKIGSPRGEAGENYVLAINYPQISVKYEEKNPLLAIGSVFRYKIASIYNNNLPPTPSSLLLGIVFGIKTNMPKEFSDLLKNSGVTHVIAASGMNISMVGGFFALAFSSFLKRRVALVFTIGTILLYAVFSGLEPSILRASIMGIMAFGAQILGRQNSSVFALLTTAFVMIFISPILIFDVGFQLSLFSTLGILLLNPSFEAKFSKIPIIKFIQGDLSTTLSAQILTIPIILGTFGSYSLISVFVNMLVLWTVPILMVLGALGAVLGMFFTSLGVLVLYISYPFLIYFEFVVKTLGSLGFVLKTSSLPWEISLGYYLILASIFIKLRQKTK